jgi:Domain of unknown function (DUF4124)
MIIKLKGMNMKSRNISLALCALLLALPLLGNAEIYKWKDKNGVVRYTDTPPPSNVKLESIDGKRAIKQSNQAPLAPVANTSPAAGKDEMKGKDSSGKPATEKVESAEESAAKLRQKNAEAEKNNKKEKDAQAKLNEENCKASKANLASYQQGGRVYKMNEKGEREYLDDAGLKAGATKAQKDVSQYCNG